MQDYLKKQFIIAGCLYTGQILSGYVLGWSAPIIPKLQNPEESPLDTIINEVDATWIGSLLYVGFIIGPYTSVHLSNVIGRKPCLSIGGVITLVGFLMLTFAENFAMILAGRLLNGLGFGIIYIITLVYIGEISSPNIRGILLAATGIFRTVGLLIMYTLGPYVSYALTGYFGLALSVIYIASIMLIPETPIFHILHGQEAKAEETLASLGRKHDTQDVLASARSTDDTNEKRRWNEVFTKKINRKALFITLSLSILQEMSGVMVVIFFATSIFELAASSIDPNVSTIIIGVTRLAASIITPFFVERSGRKTLLLVSTAFCFVSLAVFGLYFILDDIDSSLVSSVQWVPLLTLILFFLAYGVGFDIIPMILIGEMFLPNVRSTGSTITITAGWVCGFLVSTGFGYMITALGGSVTFLMYSGVCAVAFIFTLVFVPETKGRSLLEIQEMLDK